MRNRHELVDICDKIEYRQTSNISRTFVGNNIVDHSDVVDASPVGAAPTTSSFSIYGFKTKYEALSVGVMPGSMVCK